MKRYGVQVSKEIIVFYEFEIKTREGRIRRPLSSLCRRRSEGQRWIRTTAVVGDGDDDAKGGCGITST